MKFPQMGKDFLRNKKACPTLSDRPFYSLQNMIDYKPKFQASLRPMKEEVPSLDHPS